LVSSRSATRKPKPGVMKMSVSPRIACSVPPRAADSSARSAVVPTTTMRPPAARVVSIAATRAAGGRIVAVGTTSLRALEAAALRSPDGTVQPCRGDTDLFITPGFEFRAVDLLLTNFHLPRSTLLMLVAAFAGFEHMQALYRHAVEARYRFFSYGDAMLLARA